MFTGRKETPVYNLTQQAGDIHLTCYSQHPCLRYKVQISWFVEVSNIQDNQTQILSSDSNAERILLKNDHRIVVSSSCPDYECNSELTVPNTVINGTTIWCGAYTEACPGQFKFNSSKSIIITTSISSKFVDLFLL